VRERRRGVILALRTILINTIYDLASGEGMTPERMREIAKAGKLDKALERDIHGELLVRIPTKKIVDSELMTIRTSPSDAGNRIVEQVIVMVKKKVW
jgi:hypothetical protein